MYIIENLWGNLFVIEKRKSESKHVTQIPHDHQGTSP